MHYAADDFLLCNPYCEPASLDAFATFDGERITFEIRDPSIDIEISAQRRSDRNLLLKFIQCLKPREREIVVRVFWNNETQAQVARELRISPAAVCKSIKQILKRGRADLALLAGSALLQ
jgi:RNA polymerase sigma factor (sigma-70 family)